MTRPSSELPLKVHDDPWATHTVFNQVPPLESENLFNADIALAEAVKCFGGSWGLDDLAAYGALAGGPLWQAGIDANRYPPELETHDSMGNRVDHVRFHPAYHQLLEAAIGHGLHSLSWLRPGPGAHVVRSALMYLHNQAEAGTMCPVTMTHASIPVLRQTPELAKVWVPRILTGTYDPRFIPPERKAGLTIGMGMTEKQGGSDVRSNTTHATPMGHSGHAEPYRITGHKWFLSAPMSDAFLVLARTDAGPGCFLMPRWRPDGTLNAIRIQRLKDKLGNRSNASAEVEFQDAWAWMLGEEGRGIATIIEMVAQTRLDCLIGSAALMRQAVVQAVHHANYRQAFGRRLVEQPLMQTVLADLALESEAAILLGLRVAHAMDRSAANPQEAMLARVVSAIGKYWVCKRAPGHVYEAMECLGGGGYIEQSIMPRLYREAPVNAIWEGSGNIQCLDVLRAFQRSPDALEALRRELNAARGADSAYDHHLERIDRLLNGNRDTLQARARQLVEWLALGLQASLLHRFGRAEVAFAFSAMRLREPHFCYGAAESTATAILIKRALADRSIDP
ncbi:MAG: isovaleryl-CoA dehydrogenase [Aquisalimonadaceae bacterium]